MDASNFVSSGELGSILRLMNELNSKFVGLEVGFEVAISDSNADSLGVLTTGDDGQYAWFPNR